MEVVRSRAVGACLDVSNFRGFTVGTLYLSAMMFSLILGCLTACGGAAAGGRRDSNNGSREGEVSREASRTGAESAGEGSESEAAAQVEGEVGHKGSGPAEPVMPAARPVDAKALALATEAEERRVRGDAQGAERLARDALARDARASLAYNVLGAVRVAAGDDRAAVGFFERGMASAPGDARALAALCAIEYRSNNPKGALAYSSAQMRSAPTVAVRLIHARNLVEAGRSKEAWEVARSVLKQEERNADAYAVLATAAQGQRQTLLAEEVVNRGLAIDSTHPLLLRVKAELLLAQGDMSGAVKALKLAAEAHPGDTASQLAYGTVLLESGNYALAKDVLIGGASQVPSAFELRLALAEAYRASKEWDAALKEYDWLKRQRPDSPKVHYNVALLYLSALDGAPGMDVIQALQASRKSFLRYRDLAGPAAVKESDLASYLRDIENRLEREQRRLEREKRNQGSAE